MKSVGRKRIETPKSASAYSIGGAPAVYKAEGKAYTTVDPKKLIVVAFLQDGEKHVLQAVQIPLDKKAWNRK